VIISESAKFSKRLFQLHFATELRKLRRTFAAGSEELKN
jgi:hypothetical protein